MVPVPEFVVTLYQGLVVIVLYRVARPWMRSADLPPIVVEGPTPTAVDPDSPM